MSQEPTNKRLWATLVAQAKAKYSTYPSPGASHWVHEQYTKYGGKFVDTAARAKVEKLSRQFREKREELKDKPAAKSDKRKDK